MTVVGNPSRFAVEYVLDPDLGGVWLFGDMCFWCGGRRVGDFGIGTSLRDVLFLLDYIAQYSENRRNPRFEYFSDKKFYKIMMNFALFSGSRRWKASCGIPRDAPDEEEWLRHAITPRVDIFSNWDMFLLESYEDARLVYSHSLGREVNSVQLAAGEVDRILNQVRSELNEIYEEQRRMV